MLGAAFVCPGSACFSPPRLWRCTLFAYVPSHVALWVQKPRAATLLRQLHLIFNQPRSEPSCLLRCSTPSSFPPPERRRAGGRAEARGCFRLLSLQLPVEFCQGVPEATLGAESARKPKAYDRGALGRGSSGHMGLCHVAKRVCSRIPFSKWPRQGRASIARGRSLQGGEARRGILARAKVPCLPAGPGLPQDTILPASSLFICLCQHSVFILCP